MNDRLIIKIIKKIHFILLTFFIFLFLTGFFTFIALVEGFSISHLTLGDIKFEKLYLKWDKRLTIKASLIDLNELHSDNEPLTLTSLSKLSNSLNAIEEWVSFIDIQAIRYHKLRVSLHYVKSSMGTFNLYFGKDPLDGNFILTPSVLTLSFSSRSGSTANTKGRLTLDIKRQQLYAAVHLKLPNTPTLRAYAHGNDKTLSINVKADRPFTSLNDLVDFLEVDPITRPWITDYAKASQLILHECRGSFLYGKPQRLLQSLIVRASVDNAQYTFAPPIAPIIAKRADLLFNNGILTITPQNGSFYGMPTQKSHLFIDFNPPHIVLNAHILTNHAQLNDSILHLLHYYKIAVPIRQNSGLCSVDLKLRIDLNNFNTTAKGKFTPGPSDIQLGNFSFKTQGGIVTLDTTKVAFSGFDATYKNTLHAYVEGRYDTHTQKGDVQILPNSCTPTGDGSYLALSTLPAVNTKVIYHINPDKDTLQLLPSQWKLLGETLMMEGFTIPFNYKESSAVLPRLHYSVPSKIEGTLEGKVSSEKWWLQLQVDRLNTNDLLLRNRSYRVAITGDENGVKLSSSTLSHWKLNGQNFSLSPLSLKSVNNRLMFNNINVKIDNIVEGNISGEYLWKDNKGSLVLSDMLPLHPGLDGYINLEKNQKFSIDGAGENLIIHSDLMGVDFSTIEQGWKITIPDIALLSINSPLLRQYQINRGHANLFYNPREQKYTFNGRIEYPYHLMMVNEQSLSSYTFSGSHQNGQSSLRVNDRLKIEYGRSINIRANNMGINAPELARWLDIPHTHKETESPASIPIHLNATNTYLYLMKNRKVMADTLNASLMGDDLEARMTYAQGSADLLMKEGIYYVEGSRFNDRFMERLFAFSDFSGGEMSFKLAGKIDDYEGIMRIENATLKEYKLLNNVLSFINTVPSLATFSLPNYNTKGLPIKEAYSHYRYHNHQFNVDNFTLDSPELKMVGEGKMNLKEDAIQGKLTLKSDIGSKLGRVPMVGYILFGDDGSISTTVNIKGKLSDPVVETAIAKEIVTAPFNILKRTITYPFSWMMEDQKKKEKP